MKYQGVLPSPLLDPDVHLAYSVIDLGCRFAKCSGSRCLSAHCEFLCYGLGGLHLKAGLDNALEGGCG